MRYTETPRSHFNPRISLLIFSWTCVLDNKILEHICARCVCADIYIWMCVCVFENVCVFVYVCAYIYIYALFYPKLIRELSGLQKEIKMKPFLQEIRSSTSFAFAPRSRCEHQWPLSLPTEQVFWASDAPKDTYSQKDREISFTLCICIYISTCTCVYTRIYTSLQLWIESHNVLFFKFIFTMIYSPTWRATAASASAMVMGILFPQIWASRENKSEFIFAAAGSSIFIDRGCTCCSTWDETKSWEHRCKKRVGRKKKLAQWSKIVYISV